MHRKVSWLSLPFLGSSEEPEQRIAKEHTNKPRTNGDAHSSGIRYESTREATAKEVADMTEEDIVQDYNSPIHMWVSI